VGLSYFDDDVELAPFASAAAFFSRQSASCFVRRAFCFLRFGESWGVDIVAGSYHEMLA
jgi:hypothetical protein